MKRVPLALFAWMLFLVPVAGQVSEAEKKYLPPNAVPPDPALLKTIQQKTAELADLLGALRRQGVADLLLADVEIFYSAANNIMRHQEFFPAKSAPGKPADGNPSAKATIEVLDKGLLRARSLAAGQATWFPATGHTIVRGYRSRIDGSAQPYAVTFPADFGKEQKKWRTDVVLHGRDASITEVKFLRTHSDRKITDKRHWIQIDIFGRGNNAYRWAGEIDVLEALTHYLASIRGTPLEKLIDDQRVVLRGFSMGGAGTWHLGLHMPDHWCVIGPGAGFTTTHGYIPNLPPILPPYQEACLRIYDAVDYAENAFGVPIVAYSGALDPQKKAADLVEKRVKSLYLSMDHIVAPGLEHKFPPEWQAKADGLWSMYAKKPRPEYPVEVKFTTYTLKYNGYRWVEILGLHKHYEKTQVHARRKQDGYDVTTRNVRRLHLQLEPGSNPEQTLDIDGQHLAPRAWLGNNGIYHLYLAHDAGQWAAYWPQRFVTDLQRRPQKTHGLQGPIDDAFTDGFLCVRGTGKPWHDATQKYADANLARFQFEWSKWLRGDLPVKDDVEVTNDDIATKHLILFGDPSSNSFIAQVYGGLPLLWNAKEIRFAGQSVPADKHVPVLIGPNPLNANRYLVLNSGHTFHAAEFMGTNAQLYPRLGDFALLRLPSSGSPLNVEVVTAGLFDEFWQLPK
jgi:hypothetical protein